MRKFKHFPKQATCPICKTNQDKACFLMPIAGTFRKGLREGQPVHVACMLGRIKDFVWYRDAEVMALNLAADGMTEGATKKVGR